MLAGLRQIWKVATDMDRKKLLGSTIDIAYILEGSIKAIKPKPSMYNLLHATIGRDQPNKSPLVARLRSRRGSRPRAATPNYAIMAPDDPSTANRICGIEVLTPLAYSAM
jgi:hypothetical protein